MLNILKVQNKTILDSIPYRNEGEVAYCEDEDLYYMYHENNWEEIKSTPTEGGLQFTLYDLNKQLISQLEPYDEARLNDIRDTLNSWTGHQYHMLYGREINYFTLFDHDAQFDNDCKGLGDAVLEALKNVADGGVYSFDIIDDHAAEFWIKCQDYVTAMYLFNYDDGVFYYG